MSIIYLFTNNIRLFIKLIKYVFGRNQLNFIIKIQYQIKQTR